jgi:hypothetical protein
VARPADLRQPGAPRSVSQRAEGARPANPPTAGARACARRA